MPTDEPDSLPAADGPVDAPVPAFVPDPARARRLLVLRVLLKGMVGIALAAVAFVFVSAFLSDDGEEGNVAAMRVVVGDMLPGETRTLTWEGRAVLVRRRAAEEIARLRADDEASRLRLRDPDSNDSTQPDAAAGALRSLEPEWFVAIGLGTDYGCPVAWLAPERTPFAGLPWPGGFVDGCRGSRYDPAGRVYAGQYADENLAVPVHAIVGDTLVLGRAQ